MTDAEKIKKFEEVQKYLWDIAINGNPMQSTMSAAMIRFFEIESPNGESHESA